MVIVVSLGGSIFPPEIDQDIIKPHAENLEKLHEENGPVGIVVGGGDLARKYIRIGRSLGGNEVELDYVGIMAARLNAQLFSTSLRKVIGPVFDFHEAKAGLDKSELVLMSAFMPGLTTDVICAILAEYVEADMIIFATDVDGIYDRDPKTNPSAEKYSEISTEELLSVMEGITLSAGHSMPVHWLAVKLLQRSGLPAVVIDGTNPSNILRAMSEEFEGGTRIVPRS